MLFSESPVVVHAFGDNGANVYQFLHEELRGLGLEKSLKAVVFEGGPSKVLNKKLNFDNIVFSYRFSVNFYII